MGRSTILVATLALVGILGFIGGFCIARQRNAMPPERHSIAAAAPMTGECPPVQQGYAYAEIIGMKTIPIIAFADEAACKQWAYHELDRLDVKVLPTVMCTPVIIKR